MADFVVAIDGGAGSGKSTTAKAVAQRLKFFYLDTGAMYRAATLKYLKSTSQTDTIAMDMVRELIRSTDIDIRQKDSKTLVFLDGLDVTEEIRAPAVNALVSQISAIPTIREWMVRKQRAIAQGKNIVCEGRDIGTVVFPSAQVKIFMQADLKVRAQRRQKELQEKNMPVDIDEVIENLKFRDGYDSQRQHSPLKEAVDAIIVDTTHLTIEQEIDAVLAIVRTKFKPRISV